MEQNVYAPPVSAVAEPMDSAIAGHEFQVVGKTKFFVLYVLSFGLYGVVWMYQHWAQFKRTRGEDVIPVARAIFAIFFYHSLTRRIDESLQLKNGKHQWSPSMVATTTVLWLIALYLFSRFSDNNTQPVMSMLVLMGGTVISALLTWRIQYAANLACDDVKGETNSRFGVANWIWIVLFGLWWAVVLLGLFAIATASA